MAFVFSNYNPGELYNNILRTQELGTGLQERGIARQMAQDQAAFEAGEARRREAEMLGANRQNFNFAVANAMDRARQQREEGAWTRGFYGNQADLAKKQFEWQKQFQGEIAPGMERERLAEQERRRQEQEDQADRANTAIAESLNFRLASYKKANPTLGVDQFVNQVFRTKGMDQQAWWDGEEFHPIIYGGRITRESVFGTKPQDNTGIATSPERAKQLGYVLPKRGNATDVDRLKSWPVGTLVLSPDGRPVLWDEPTRNVYLKQIDEAYRLSKMQPIPLDKWDYMYRGLQ